MKRRFLVVYGRWDGRRGCWHETAMPRRTMRGARALAERRAQAHRAELSWTAAGGSRHCSTVFIQDAATKASLFDHPGFRVPSIGELGVTP